MSRNYFDENIRIERTGLCSVTLRSSNGETKENLMPKRLFPMSNLKEYIALIDKEGKEYGIIKDLSKLDSAGKTAVEECLNEYYMMPKIKQIVGCRDKFGVLHFEAETDKGHVGFDIRNRHYDIKKLPDNRVLMRDRNDNRYEIEDYTKLDKKSIKKLYQYI